jgi:Putative polyhydroxyalkanoic acid system protein (PHA_gran_rgn)
MKHAVPHDLGLDKAKKVTEAAWQSYSDRFSAYHPTCDWQSNSRAKIGFTVKGVSLKGGIEVNEHSIDLEMDVPFLLKPFTGKAVGVIEEEIKKWIAKSKAGEL